MYQQQKCASCRSAFTQANVARIIPTCGHNLCSNCLKHLVSSKATSLLCSDCDQTYTLDEDDLQSFPKNITIIKQLRQSSASASQASESGIDQNSHSEQTDNSGSLLMPPSSLRSSLQTCQLHGKPLEIICTVDKGLLCAHCALFSEHRNHELRTLQKFQQEIDKLKSQFKSIKNRRKEAEASIKGSEYRGQLVKQVNKKKDELIVEIRAKFANLMQMVKDAQAKIYDQLVQAFRSIDTHISRAGKEEHELQNTYSEWFKRAQAKVSAIQNTRDIGDRINLFYDPSLSLKQGEACVREIEEKNRSIKETVNSMIESIRMEYSVSMEGYVYNYARVSFTPVQLTPSDHLIQMAPNTRENYREVKSKPIKAQFIKSEDLYFSKPDNFDNQPSMKSPKKPSVVSPRTGIVSPTRPGVVSPPNRMRPNPKDANKKLVKPEMNKRNSRSPNNMHHENLDFAERMLNEFRKSTETLDLTGCDMGDNQILHVVSIAAEEKPIKCIKVTKNKLTNNGLGKLLTYMEHATNINVSYNALTDEAVDEFINQRESLPNLRIINLSHNKLNERKVKSKIEELKRMGIIATL